MSALGGDLSGLTVVDLFAGSGALGLEALSRGAVSAVFVERSPTVLRTLESNVDQLDCRDRVTLVRGDALGYAKRAAVGTFDVALADPPYGKGYATRLVDLFGRHPFAQEIWVEHRFDERLPEPPGRFSRRYGDTMVSSIPASRTV